MGIKQYYKTIENARQIFKMVPTLFFQYNSNGRSISRPVLRRNFVLLPERGHSYV